MKINPLQAQILVGNYMAEEAFGTADVCPSITLPDISADAAEVAIVSLADAGFVERALQPLPVLGDGALGVMLPGGLRLTPLGRDLVKSRGKEFGLFNFNFNVTVGGVHIHNKVDVGGDFKLAVKQQIDNSSATPDQKKEALGKLDAFVSHPLVNTILGAALGSLLPK
jgi:hypothetical protein